MKKKAAFGCIDPRAEPGGWMSKHQTGDWADLIGGKGEYTLQCLPQAAIRELTGVTAVSIVQECGVDRYLMKSCSPS